jgi:DME family drug/metabolite transporter
LPTGFVAGFSLALLSAVIWAIAPVLYRRGVDQFSYTALGAARTIGSILTAGAYLFATMGQAAFTPPPLPLLLAIFGGSVIWLVAGDLLYFVSLRHLGVTLGVPVCSAYPLLAVPASWIFLGEPASPIVFGAAILIVTGLVLLSPRRQPDAMSVSRKDFRIGLFFALLCMSCWTFGIITNKFFMERLPVPQLEWWRSVSVLCGSWVLFWIRDRKVFPRVSSPLVLGEAMLAGALGLTVGNLLFSYSQTFIPVDLATCVASARPFFSAAFAALFLREKLTPRLASGIALVVAGVTVMSL